MRDYEYDLSQVYHHRFRVEQAAAELKAMRQAPPNSYLPKDIRGAELGYDFWRSRLRITEDILRRYHPDQPRVPAGNPDGGQWTDGGGGFGSGRSSPSVDPIKTGATADAATNSQPATTAPAKGPSTGSWIGEAMRAVRPRVRRIPGVSALSEIIDGMDWTDDIDSHIQEYNRLATEIGPDTTLIPIISARARSYSLDKDETKVAVGTLSRDEVIKHCPNYLTVQELLNQATAEVDAVSKFDSMANRGTHIHYEVALKVRSIGNPNLKAEKSLLKSGVAQVGGTNRSTGKEPWVPHGPDTIRIDVYDRASDKLVCVYDPKTGDNEITFPRLDEIGGIVARNFGEGMQFFVVGMRPFE
ncbi:hypothetical protein [Phyllobacterium bourgognense]|uniref:Restriction endonuclease n=1 Tax=Phyllobacterium bourgognense TaxID=314236 RepID=A0A368Z0U7_9HYPH|nr:hypothetical protein [Phyllobacterium bourgognense]RCW86080.1 hypothetical protein C7476_10257 [Phyllobacterium bourgognense]